MAPKGRGRKKVLEKLPKGTILTDVAKLQWKIIEPIGEGGFGVIYSVENVSSSTKSKTSYVAKVEPHSNGPLFVEKNFFMRNLQPKMIAEYKQAKNLKFLGLPEYIGGGTHKQGDVEHRFLIMERFGDSIDKKLQTSTGVNYKLLGTYCSQIIDALMYIHDRGYAHMDVKPENLLLKFKSEDEKVYLIDFGIVDRCTTSEKFIPDKKKQHNGTVLYTSRDSHQGVITKRADLEILGYNILQWLGVELPWKGDIKDLIAVQEKKNKFMSDIKKVLPSKTPKGIVEYFNYVNKLEHNENPDYGYIKSLLQTLDNPVKVTPTKRKTGNGWSISALKDGAVEEESSAHSRKQKTDPKKANRGASSFRIEKDEAQNGAPKSSARSTKKEKSTLDDEVDIVDKVVKSKPLVKKRITSPKKRTSPKRILSPQGISPTKIRKISEAISTRRITRLPK